jgi:hypothetical protein
LPNRERFSLEKHGAARGDRTHDLSLTKGIPALGLSMA